MRTVEMRTIMTRTSSLLVLLACLAPGCTERDPDEGDAGTIPDAGADASTPPDAGPGYRVFFGEGVGPEVEQQFRDAPTGSIAAPEIAYPESGTLVPPNMVGVDIHFRAGLLPAFEIAFAQGGELSVVAYVRCAPVNGGCIFQPWREVWRELSDRRTAGPYEITVRGLAGDGATATSAPIELELADEEIQGGVYYLAPEDHPPSIRRHELGIERRSSEVFLETTEYVPSHSLTRDGSRIAVSTQTGTGGAIIHIYDVATRAPAGVLESSEGFVARYGPGEDMVLSMQGADVFDAFPIQLVSPDGTVLEEFEHGAAHSASWSPDGDRIAFDVTTELVGIHFVFELQLLERVDGAWQAPRTLATPDILGAYQPTFAPDSDWIGFTALDRTDQDVHGTYAPLLVALRASDARMVHLRRALGSADRYVNRPEAMRWNPSPYDHDGRRIYWFTFSTARPCGLLPEVDHETTGGRQVWMAAFDPEADPDDPSRPAFRIPAQRWGLDNGAAEWSLEVQRLPCETDDDCPEGEMCLDGFCYEAPE
jgi:TolB protein